MKKSVKVCHIFNNHLSPKLAVCGHRRTSPLKMCDQVRGGEITMGWASGSSLAETVWRIVRIHIPKANRQRVAKGIVDAFEERDCDTMEEAESLYEASGLAEKYREELRKEEEAANRKGK